MTMGLTYTRGRTIASTTESGSGITRVTGQFARTRSCPVQSSGPHRVRVTVDGMLTATSGAVVIYLDPDNTYNGGGQQNNGLVLDWRTDANNRITLQYDKANTRWQLDRIQSGTATNPVQLTDTFTAGAAIALYVAWDAGNLYIAVDGGAVTSAVNARNPTLPTTFDVGSQDGSTASSYFNAAYGALLMFSAPLTTAQWQGLAALRALRAPLFGEWAQPTGMWLGAHSQVWTLPSSGQWFDFINTTNFTMEELNDGGIATPLHRMIETPLRDGATYVDTRLQPRMFSLGVSFGASTIDAMFDLRRQMAAALNPRRGQGLLMFAPYDEGYEITAMLNSFPFNSRFAMFARQPAAFLCTDPLWRKVARTESVVSVPQGGWSITWTIPWTITESAISQSVTNEGDVDSYPKFVITAGSVGLEDPYVENTTTGETFRLQGVVLAANEYVTIDMDARTVVKNDGTNLIGYRTSESRMWALEPGSNTVKCGAEAGSGTAQMSHAAQLVGV